MPADVHHQTSCLIHFGDLDPMGIVWHGNYFRFFEAGREAFGHQHGLDAMHFHEHGVFTPIVRSTIEHKAMLGHGDTAVIRTSYVPTPAAKIQLRYTVHSERSGALAATGETVQVFLDRDRKLLLDAPAVYKEWKALHGFA